MITIMSIVWWVLLILFAGCFGWSLWQSLAAFKAENYDWIAYSVLSVLFLSSVVLAWFTIQALKECAHVL